MNSFRFILYVAFVFGSSFASATAGPVSTRARCEANIMGPDSMVDFVSYAQFIADDYRHIDYALHAGDISPHVASGQFVLLNVGPRDQILVIISRAEHPRDHQAFVMYLVPVNQRHLARSTPELDAALGGQLNAIVRDHYPSRDVKTVLNERVGLAYFEVEARRDDLGRFNSLLKRLNRLTR